ncbi:precorrin-6y C5,15-methyltransferase (decarboxylating) subunit CbiE [Thetidibacter halocola]|uniref:Precorrin-6y C5,15-methyltransferase (Decarboxylating) subunit CbiE n=1 Tax=Thetidibacter halocola TaxID=2827239 RepID=A0A8J7WAJ0_9RHOB|nr:precorrin-6y C5,15-methyltransferase (decarboxylating) subunit CbiE [Thetidibacter halocola]MBS0123982.1 precorrin-6y C5,15-methyltransferase (decarboxylating) subunit CbiE [Thetidibacter halocola]
MSELLSSEPWLTIVGLGEDGPDGLPPASRAALDAAEIVIGPPRHLSLLDLGSRAVAWPAPFADGIPLLLSHRGRPTVMLASGDPFWFGAGSVVTRQLEPGEWRALPGPSCFALACARLGWPLEAVTCLAQHAAPLARLRPHLAPGLRVVATLRDGDAVLALADYLCSEGFGATHITVLESLGGPRESLTRFTSDAAPDRAFAHPLVVALEPMGPALPLATGRPDAWFENDGQITKRPVRALTLSALAPKPGEHLWDIGGGSGSIVIEWLLAHPATAATCIERDATRAARIRENAARLGQDRLHVVEGAAPAALDGLPPPDAVFIGGGLSRSLLDRVQALAPAARIVANAVTLESEALLIEAHARLGGDLLRVELSEPAPIGPRRGWRASYPILQWSLVP